MPSSSREDRIKGTLTLEQWRRQEVGWEQRPRPWWLAGHEAVEREEASDVEGQEHEEGQEDQEDAVEAFKRREGSKTRRWRDMSGEPPMMAEEPPVAEPTSTDTHSENAALCRIFSEDGPTPAGQGGHPQL